MGSTNSSNNPTTALIDTSIPINDDVFKVDNINSYGRKHATAKIEVSNDNLCIKQKHRQSLHIPLETIKRYGLDGSIFILECGRHSPLGQARYAFRCKQARRLVDCLDLRITVRSKQLLEQQRQGIVMSSASTLTNISSTSHSHRRRRRTQSDQEVTRRASSSVLLSSSSSSSISLTSRAAFCYRNSEPNLAESYLSFDTLPCRVESSSISEEGQFIARLKHPVEKRIVPELNYVQFKVTSIPITVDEEEPSTSAVTVEPDVQPTKKSPVQPRRKRAILSLFNHHQPSKSNKTSANLLPVTPTSVPESTSINTPYVYIDHEKTTTLKDIAYERLQQQLARRVDI